MTRPGRPPQELLVLCGYPEAGEKMTTEQVEIGLEARGK
jgi:hypothetical protein